MSNEPLSIGNPTETPEQSSVTDADAIFPDILCDVLADPYRRSVLAYLDDRMQADITELAEHVAGCEHESTVGTTPTDIHERVFTSLYHCHLPKLSDAGLIEYDQAQGVVELAENDVDIEPYLALAA